MAVKNWEGYLSCEGPLRSGESQLHTQLPSLGHQRQEEDFPRQLATKISRDSVRVRQRTAVDPGVLLKGLSRPACSLTLALSSKEGTAMGKVLGTYMEERNFLTSRRGLEEQLSPGLKYWQALRFLC